MIKRYLDSQNLLGLVFLALLSGTPTLAHAAGSAGFDFETADENSQPAPEPVQKITLPSSNLLSLYKRGSPSSSVIGKIDPAYSKALKRYNHWVRVIDNKGQVGFVKKNLWDKAQRHSIEDATAEAGFTGSDGLCLDGNCVNSVRVSGGELPIAMYDEVKPGESLSYAKKISQNLRKAKTNYCWRGTWETLKAAGLVKGELTQNSAKNAFEDLRKFGFRHDPKACSSPGVVRVYDSPPRQILMKISKRRRTAGDIHGHTEILLPNGLYHHFTTVKHAINSSYRFGPERRPLKYCLVKKV